MNTIYVKVALLVALSICTLSPAFARRIYRFDKDFVMNDGKLQIKVVKVQELSEWAGLVVEVLLTNSGSEIATFNVDEVELVNNDNNEVFYSISKDKSMVSLPHQVGNRNILLRVATVNPDRTSRGCILYMPGKQIKKLKDFDVIYKGQKLNVSAR